MNYIFDFDGTLADSEQCSILATQKAFEQCDLHIPDEAQIKYYMGIPIEKSFVEMASRTLSVEEFDQLLVVFREAYKEFETATLTLFPNISHVLQQLQSNNHHCFVLSSKKTEVLKRNLEALQISHYFKDAFGSDRVQNYKPDPDGIFAIQQAYDFAAIDTMMIGDAIFDLQMGKAANVKTCAVTWGSHSVEQLSAENPDFIIDEALQLLAII